jgi:crossover junction endodeoxyribonuclease RusA
VRPLLDVTILGSPKGQGSMRVIRGRALHPTATLEHRTHVALALAEEWAGRPPLDEALDVALWFTFIRPRSHYRSGRHSHELRPDAPEHMAVPIDIDKASRLCLDGGTYAGLWRDDALVTRLRATKQWASYDAAPSTRVMLWRAGQGW